MITTEWRDETLKLIQGRPAWLKLKKIAEDTTIPVGWLKVFAQGRIEDPSVNRVQTIKEYLTKITAKV